MSFSKTIFMTGFPGFIAERLVARLARADLQFFLLVQPQFVEKSMKSIDEIASRTNTPPENFALIEGDITQADLGMSPEDIEAVRETHNRCFPFGCDVRSGSFERRGIQRQSRRHEECKQISQITAAFGAI